MIMILERHLIHPLFIVFHAFKDIWWNSKPEFPEKYNRFRNPISAEIIKVCFAKTICLKEFSVRSKDAANDVTPIIKVPVVSQFQAKKSVHLSCISVR